MLPPSTPAVSTTSMSACVIRSPFQPSTSPLFAGPPLAAGGSVKPIPNPPASSGVPVVPSENPCGQRSNPGAVLTVMLSFRRLPPSETSVSVTARGVGMVVV